MLRKDAMRRAAVRRVVPHSSQNSPAQNTAAQAFLDSQRPPTSHCEESTPSQKSSMVTISEVKGNSRENRTAAHTHIKGLGLKSNGYAETTGAGFVGQVTAREVGVLEFSLGRAPKTFLADVDQIVRLVVLSSTS